MRADYLVLRRAARLRTRVMCIRLGTLSTLRKPSLKRFHRALRIGGWHVYGLGWFRGVLVLGNNYRLRKRSNRATRFLSSPMATSRPALGGIDCKRQIARYSRSSLR